MKRIVVLTGAGISAESGLKTFRASDGLWENYPIEKVATFDAWSQNPKMVLDFYNERRKQIYEAKPNPAHHSLVELEKKYTVEIITQNIDDLHERAGSKNVLPKKKTSFFWNIKAFEKATVPIICLLYTSPSPRDKRQSRMPSSA